jgi:PiT family inorganic phosphate transporter
MLASRLLTIWSGRLRSTATLNRRLRRWHAVAFALQCLAYGTNDGQKMIAVIAVASGPVVGAVAPRPWQLAVVGGCFLLGAVYGLPRFAATVGSGVLPIRPPEAVTTELSAGVVVLTTGALGAPVSMTQATSGALVGAGVGRGYGAIRWDAAARIGGAWLVTLPAAFGVAALAAVLIPTL